VNSAARGSWACLDAVGLTTASGQTTWATTSSASTVYAGGSLTAATEKKPWYSLFW
jgi:hypothetical protein